MAYEFLITARKGAVEHVSLNRPKVRNAFNPQLIAELTDWASGVEREAADRGLRVAVLEGAGTVFCAGADLSWMAETVAYSEAENLRDAKSAARLFTALDRIPVPLIGRVQGAALGGGCGLTAVCDIVVAEEAAVFALTEVKLGIVSAVISPFVLAKIGRAAARELFLTGAKFGAARAREIGLVHAVVPASDLDAAIDRYVREILSAGPEAVAAAKALIREVWGLTPEDAEAITALAIASRRVSPEGQEGLRAFLEKRRPSWIDTKTTTTEDTETNRGHSTSNGKP